MDINNNPLVIPPPEVLNRGTPAVLMWLRKNEKTVRNDHSFMAFLFVTNIFLQGRNKHVTGLSFV